MTVLRVALPVRLPRPFDYRSLDDQTLPPPGARVRVPLGRRMVIGVVVEHATTSSIDPKRLKSIDAIVDSSPLFNDELFDLCLWVSRYYHHPLGEVLATAMPAWLREGREARVTPQWQWQLTEVGATIKLESLGRAVRQRRLVDALTQGSVAESELLGRLSLDRSVIRALESKGWIARSRWQPIDDSTRTVAPRLSESQTTAVEAVVAAGEGFMAWLLDGVTGSGKTEVYLHLIKRVIESGRQALVIVPEIGLTPQLMSRFRSRLGDCVGVLHSAMSDGDRLRLWLAARAGELKVVLGTRSAVFVPLARPGMIVVDEEHDASLKQADGLRYSARDIAVMRARRAGIPVVLGSATPSLESLHNARRGRYQRLCLPRRAGSARPPALKVIDLRGQREEAGLSVGLHNAVTQHLERGEQVLLFLNRRGFSPVLMCQMCGWYAECPRCDARMTLHRSERSLRCHHCDHRRSQPRHCPDCNSDCLEPLGLGTERLEDEVTAAFPQFEVLRVDRDTVRRRDAWTQVMERLASGRPCILMGTQMLAKGHDYPNITLVGVINLDQALFSSDFRAAERAAQLLIQVSGRAGRADKPGTVLVQTRHPDHPLFTELLTDGYGQFANGLLIEREAAGYPPVGRMVLLRAEASSQPPVAQFLSEAASCAGHPRSVQVLGPLVAPMERRAGRYRMQLILLSSELKALHDLLGVWVDQLHQLPTAGKVRWSLDVDPGDTF